MYDAGGLRRLGVLRHRPGARLLGPDGEEGDEVEQAISGVDDASEARLVQVEMLEEFALLGLVGELRHFRLDGGGDDDAGSTLLTRILHDARRLRIALCRCAFFDI